MTTIISCLANYIKKAKTLAIASSFVDKKTKPNEEVISKNRMEDTDKKPTRRSRSRI